MRVSIRPPSQRGALRPRWTTHSVPTSTPPGRRRERPGRSISKLGGPRTQRRYTAPSYEISNLSTGSTASIPGFNPAEVYETAIANLAPELDRRARPASVEAVLGWAREPLATVEVAAVARLDPSATRAALSKIARPIPAGAEFYWTLDSA